MSPSLEGIMFNRDANLSARRPLLAEPQKAVLVPRAPPRDTGPPRPAHRNLPYKHNDFQNGYQWKPSNVEIERRLREMQEKRIREKIGYFQEKIPPRDASLDRREAELIFKFDPHASAEYMASQQQQRVLGSRPPPSPSYSRLPAARDGPFVFGVHSPSQFPLRRDDPDYAEVDDNDDTAQVNCCDSVKELADKTKKRTKHLKYQIKDKGKVDKCGKKNKIKCVLVGDGAVGKSSLIAAYAQDTFREEYQPTAYDTFNVVVDVDDRSVCVEICDTAGQDNMSELRELCYPGTDVLMLCFSVVRPETFRSVAERWTKAVAKLNAPVILVGTQSDLAADPRVVHNLRTRGEYIVSEAEARSLATKINANYIETSAKTRNQLKDAFDAAILAGLPVIQSKKSLWKKLFCFS